MGCRDRILAWREWRKGLEDLTLEEALAETARAWANVPLVNHYLVPEEVDKWPTPWELISDNHYCDLAICLGMFYSLELSKHRTHDIVMNLYRADSESTWYHLCQIGQGKYVLNWNRGGIVNNSTLQKSALLVYQYKEIDLASKLG